MYPQQKNHDSGPSVEGLNRGFISKICIVITSESDFDLYLIHQFFQY